MIKFITLGSYEQLYWLTRLDSIKSMIWIVFAFCVVFIFVYLIGTAVALCDCDDDEIREWKTTFRPWKWVASILLVLNLILGVFVPNKNDVLLIMGAGTVLEYVKTNQDLQALPDKAVEALTLWSDNFLEEQKAKTKDSQ